MHISIILAHPDENSFNHAIANTVLETLKKLGHNTNFHDLYFEKFNPILPVDELPKDALLTDEISDHCNEISNADGIIIIHPNWWGQPPAILKGWVDRVLRAGVAYEFIGDDNGEGVPNGLLNAKTALVFNTSNTSTNRVKSIFDDPLELLWNNCIFDLCGINNFYRRMFNIIVTSSDLDRKKWLNEVEETVTKYFR